MIMSECTPRMTQFPSGPYDDQTAQWLHGVGSIRQRTRPPSIIIVINWRINSIIIQGTRLNYLPESFLAKGRQCVTHHPRILTDRKAASQPARQVLSRVTCVARRVAGQSMRLSPKSPPEIDGSDQLGATIKIVSPGWMGRTTREFQWSMVWCWSGKEKKEGIWHKTEFIIGNNFVDRSIFGK